MMQAVVVICGLLLGLFLAAIGQAAVSQPLVAGWLAILSNPWSLVALLDLGIGLLFVACWIAVVETRLLHALGWIVALALLGNAATLAFLLCRSRRARTLKELFLPTT